MEHRTLLLVTYHFPPSAASGSFRMTGFARHLPSCGWRVVVVTPQAGALWWEPQDPGMLEQVPPETVVVRAPYNLSRLSYPLKYWLPINSWLPRAWQAARRAARQYRPDAVLTSGPPHSVHAVGLALQREFGLPAVADFRDPWIRLNKYLPTGYHFPTWVARQCEQAVMRRADAIIVNAPRAKDALAEEYPHAAGRMTVITNGYDPERFPTDAERPERVPTDPLRIAYTGQFYADRHPGGLLDAIQSLRQDPAPGMPPLDVEFFGKLDSTVDVRAEIERRGLEDVVHIRGHVPYAESLRIMGEADVLLLVDQAGRLRGVPAKLYEYLGAGRPVLAMIEPDSDTSWVLGESDLPYRMASPSDARGIRQALIELADAARNHRDETAHPGRLAFTRPRLAAALAELLEQCVLRRAEGRPVEAVR